MEDFETAFEKVHINCRSKLKIPLKLHKQLFMCLTKFPKNIKRFWLTLIADLSRSQKILQVQVS